jgi:hypothetical protein
LEVEPDANEEEDLNEATEKEEHETNADEEPEAIEEDEITFNDISDHYDLKRRKQNFSDLRINEFGQIINSDEDSDDDDYQEETDTEDDEDQEDLSVINATQRTFKCAKCDSVFKWNSGLTAHIRHTHTGNFKCNQCNNNFKDKKHLENHMVIHKPIEDSMITDDLEEETATNTEEETTNTEEETTNTEEETTNTEEDTTEDILFEEELECNICQKNFASLSNLKRHKMAKHPEENKKKSAIKRKIEEVTDEPNKKHKGKKRI